MDTNKLKVLKEIGYKVYRTCNNCKHAYFNRGFIFAACKKYTYEHLKHTESHRELSIVSDGICKSHEYREFYEQTLEDSGFTQFLEK